MDVSIIVEEEKEDGVENPVSSRGLEGLLACINFKFSSATAHCVKSGLYTAITKTHTHR